MNSVEILGFLILLSFSCCIAGNNIIIADDRIGDIKTYTLVTEQNGDNRIAISLIRGSESAQADLNMTLPSVFRQDSPLTWSADPANISAGDLGDRCFTYSSSTTENVTLCNEMVILDQFNITFTLFLKNDKNFKILEVRSIPWVNYTDATKTTISLGNYTVVQKNLEGFDFQVVRKDTCGQSRDGKLPYDENWTFDFHTIKAPIFTFYSSQPSWVRMMTLCSKENKAFTLNGDIPAELWHTGSIPLEEYCLNQTISCNSLSLKDDQSCTVFLIISDANMEVMTGLQSKNVPLCQAIPGGAFWPYLLLGLVILGLLGAGVAFIMRRKRTEANKQALLE